MNAANNKNEERRKAKRLVVQESFALFLVIPKVHGMVRLYMRDLSRLGLCFRTELTSVFAMDQKISFRLYMNPSFYLPMQARVVRVKGEEIAIEFLEPESKPVIAVARLMDFLDAAMDAGELESSFGDAKR